MTSRGAVGRAVIKNTYAVEWLPCNEQLLLSVHPPLSPWPLDLTFFRNDAASTSPHPPPPPPSFNNLPSDALVPRHRCLDAVLSPPLPPASRIRATLLGTIPVELARGMANEIANTVPVYVSPVYIGRPCCLCSFPLISPRLPATDLPSRFHRVYTRWIGVYSFLMPRGGSILLKERFYLYIFEGDIF